ncbi:PEPxxWA-CTERM sorting domain-containing protein [Sphingomonas nostoxanthinifaciens]|uniref:PEPxxWA-CTERM sorting domain-containing protein n=1 Tax=Sphingomonas nostoxanthinifaciens TaxID=2872652 RepID=UPI001CC1FDB3|nr:PEPxxWA-CTERM sorting domain-containing protein [Sphingomonas nostoxanthinifaciens]UAK23138.1 PEPxxWA-CTERM sorting domain-containing protein [Sphingomonas nostoxanthinifaciens]
MKRISQLVSTAIFVTAALFGSEAGSTVPYTVTYNGVVTSGQGVGVDFASVFGNGADLVGDPVTVVFTIDPTKADVKFSSSDGSDRYGPVHAEEYDLTSKSLASDQLAITATVKIGDLFADVATSVPASDQIDQAAATRSFIDTFSSRTTNINFYDPATGLSRSVGNNTGFGTPYDVFDRPVDEPLSYDSPGGTGGVFAGNGSPSYFFVVYDITKVTVAQIAAVPENGSWAMMLLGFGAVGGIMRRRPRARLRFG